MKLPKALIKKYGISKKAWSIFRGRHTTKNGGIETMARRRFGRRGRSYGLSHIGRFRRHGGRRGMAGGKLGWIVGAGLYGAVRQKASDALSPLTSKIPLGNVSDEVGMLAVAWAADKFLGSKQPFIHEIAKAAMIVESARIGEAVATGQLGGFMSSGSSSSVQVIG